MPSVLHFHGDCGPYFDCGANVSQETVPPHHNGSISMGSQNSAPLQNFCLCVQTWPHQSAAFGDLTQLTPMCFEMEKKRGRGEGGGEGSVRWRLFRLE